MKISRRKFLTGGAKCRIVCPWSVPQRQPGVCILTSRNNG